MERQFAQVSTRLRFICDLANYKREWHVSQITVTTLNKECYNQQMAELCKKINTKYDKIQFSTSNWQAILCEPISFHTLIPCRIVGTLNGCIYVRIFLNTLMWQRASWTRSELSFPKQGQSKSLVHLYPNGLIGFYLLVIS